MERTRKRTVAGLVMGVCAVGLTGCNDDLKAKDAHIALLEDTNQQLAAELASARSETQARFTERDRLNGNLLAANDRLARMQSDMDRQPEPMTPEGWQAVPGGAMIAIEGSVLFPSGKAELRNTGGGPLDAITSTIRSTYPNKDVYVFGHTDNAPIKKSGWKDNYELSAQRALTVVRYLKDHGIDPQRLVACGAGEHRPRVPNSSPDGQAKNRRVEIFAVDAMP